jgi:hypothetical protein
MGIPRLLLRLKYEREKVKQMMQNLRQFTPKSLQQLCIDVLDTSDNLCKVIHLLPEDFEYFDFCCDKLKSKHVISYKKVMFEFDKIPYVNRCKQDPKFKMDVELVMSQTNCNIIDACTTLDQNDGDIVNTIMYILHWRNKEPYAQ